MDADSEFEAMVERAARELARCHGHDPDETWQEFDRDAHHSHAAIGETYEDPTIVRWTTFADRARAALTASGVPELLAEVERLNRGLVDAFNAFDQAATRAETAEAELARLRAEIDAAPVATIISAHMDHIRIDPPAGIPFDMLGQRVRLLTDTKEPT